MENNIIKFDKFLEGRQASFSGLRIDSKINCYKIVYNQGSTLSETILIPSSLNDAIGTYTIIIVNKSTDEIMIQEVGTYEIKEGALYKKAQLKK